MRRSLALDCARRKIVQAECIIVLDKGKLVESGTHDALVAQGGVYAKLEALQFGRPSVLLRILDGIDHFHCGIHTTTFTHVHPS